MVETTKANDAVRQRLPVTVLSGGQCAGKSTLLIHVSNKREGRRVAVLANGISDVNIDAELLRRAGVLPRAQEELVEMSNGSNCGTLRALLDASLTRPYPKIGVPLCARTEFRHPFSVWGTS
jgi:hypothetical protein